MPCQPSLAPDVFGSSVLDMGLWDAQVSRLVACETGANQTTVRPQPSARNVNMAGTKDEISDLHQHASITEEQYAFPLMLIKCYKTMQCTQDVVLLLVAV